MKSNFNNRVSGKRSRAILGRNPARDNRMWVAWPCAGGGRDVNPVPLKLNHTCRPHYALKTLSNRLRAAPPLIVFWKASHWSSKIIQIIRKWWNWSKWLEISVAYNLKINNSRFLGVLGRFFCRAFWEMPCLLLSVVEICQLFVTHETVQAEGGPE